jgi:hypothetical protein
MTPGVILDTKLQVEGRLTAIRVRPDSSIDQYTDSVSETVLCVR